jgi:hypothetical protein
MPSSRRQRVPLPATPTHLTWPSAADIDETLRQRFVSAITAAAEKGDVVIVHPKARSKAGHTELGTQLRQWGVPAAIVAVLGWETMNPTLGQVPAPARSTTPARSEPEPSHTERDFSV